MKPYAILTVDDDPDFLKGIIRQLQKGFEDIEILGKTSGEAALKVLEEREIGVLLSDLRMPGLSGHDLLERSLALNPRLCAVMVTGYATVEAAVQALKAGAWDFITKPVERQTLFHTVEKAVEHYDLARENHRLKALVATMAPDRIDLWQSRSMKQLQEKIMAIAVTDYTVLVTGESGAGKEHIARQIHSLSGRKNDSCQALNCPAIPEPLLESELFGHVKGAFTGAERSRDGFFMAADKGTLILDEIGEISLPIQAKLLKFLQDKEVKPVGSSISRTADVRIIALTNQNLVQRIEAGLFRQDLYYRLNVLSLVVPPLRERQEDIPILVRQFLAQTCQEMGMPVMDIDPSAMAFLSCQTWPGNVRELQNYMRRLVVFSNGKTIDMGLVSLVEGKLSYQGPAPDSGSPMSYCQAKQEALDLFSRDYLTRLFVQTRGNISETARLSGLERASIQKIVKRLGLEMDRFRTP